MTARLPALVCPACGVEDRPRIGPGAGPHGSRAECAHCGRFIQWLRKERAMQACINKTILLGAVARAGVEVAFLTSGNAKASFTLVLSESGPDGREFTTLVPVEVVGRRAEATGELEAGDLVVIEGKIGKRKRGESWELIVTAFDAQPLRAPAGG
jgi:hypothetical protein